MVGFQRHGRGIRPRARPPPRGGQMANPLFATKSYETLMKEMAGEHRLRRVLGPVALTSLGVGAIIGTGIFVLTGVAAHDKTGPALMLSFRFAGIASLFPALRYPALPP